MISISRTTSIEAKQTHVQPVGIILKNLINIIICFQLERKVLTYNRIKALSAVFLVNRLCGFWRSELWKSLYQSNFLSNHGEQVFTRSIDMLTSHGDYAIRGEDRG